MNSWNYKKLYLPTALSTLVFLAALGGAYLLISSSLNPTYRSNRNLHHAEYALAQVITSSVDSNASGDPASLAAGRDAMEQASTRLMAVIEDGDASFAAMAEESRRLQAWFEDALAAGRPPTEAEWGPVRVGLSNLHLRLEMKDQEMLQTTRNMQRTVFDRLEFYILVCVGVMALLWILNSFWFVPRYTVGPMLKLLEAQRRQEAQIRQSEAQLQAIADTTASGVVLADENGLIKFWNPAAERLLACPRETAIGSPLKEILVSEDGSALPLLAGLPDPENMHRRRAETIVRRHDGTPLAVALTFSSTTLEGSLHTVGVFRDLTEQRRLEAEVEQQHVELQVVYDNTPIMIGVVDETGTLIYTNPAFTEYAGPNHGSCLGIRLGEALGCTHAEEAEGGCGFSIHCAACHLRGALRSALAGNTRRHEFEHHEVLMRDGVACPTTLLGTAVSMVTGEQRRVLLCLQDITERKMIERALGNSEARMALVLDSATDGWWDWDLAKQQLHCSDRWFEMLGYPADSLPPDPEMWQNLSHPEDLVRVMEHIQDALVSSQPFYEIEVRLRHVMGHYVPVLSRSRILRDAEGVPVRLCGFNIDLSEAKRREGEYERLLQTSMDGFCLCDREGRLLRVNQALCTMLQYPEHELLQMKIADLEANESPEEVALRIVRIQNTGHDFFESRWRRRDGDPIDVEVAVSSLHGAEGRTFAFLRDISQRKAFEASLRASEARFRSYVERAPIGAVVVDKNGRYVDANEAMGTLLGYTRDELLTMGIQDVLDPGSRAAGLENFQTVARGEISVGEVLLTRKNGVSVPTEIHASRLDADRFLGFHIDLTERKKMEATVLHQAALDAALAEVSQAMLAEEQQGVDLAGPILRHAMRLTESALTCLIARGREPGSVTILRPDCPDLALPRENEDLDPDDPDAAIFEALWAHLGQVEAPTTYSVSPDGPRGEALPENILVLPILQRGEWMGQIVLANALREYSAADLSSLGRLAELYRLHLLGAQIRQELESAREQFLQAQKMESVGRLAGGVAHDFNNILGVIIGYSDFALHDESCGGEFRDHLVAMRKAALRGADLTRQLLAFARKQAVQPRLLDLNDSVGAMLKLLGQLAGERVGMHWHPVNQPLQIRIDPSQLDQLLANLIVNARDAMAGSGTITIETACEFVDGETCVRQGSDGSAGTYAVLAVADSGCGMDAATLSHIFEPFFTTKPEGQGTGLGLATVHGIVHQNGGFVLATSEAGRGTTFRIYIPLQETGEISAIIPADRLQGDSFGTETILLVDDQIDFRDACRRILECLGYHVITARDGQEAIERLNGGADGDAVQLLVTDLVMPGMNGRDLWAHLSTRYPNLRCIYMSGYTADVIGEQGVLDESISLIDKPFSMSTLARRIREVLDA